MGKAISNLLSNISDIFATQVAVMFLNLLLTAGSVVMLYLLSTFHYSRKVSVLLALLYGFSTIAWYYAKSAFSEPLVVFLLLLAIYYGVSRRPLFAGVALGFMILTRQTSILLAIPVIVWVFYFYMEKNGADL
jgi:4-amino-4-deoxy-L-arabinose transferase-like glycosyltransferase